MYIALSIRTGVFEIYSVQRLGAFKSLVEKRWICRNIINARISLFWRAEITLLKKGGNYIYIIETLANCTNLNPSLAK